MPQPIPTTFNVLLPNLLRQIQTVTTFPAERCGVSQSGDPEQFMRQAEQVILMRCGDQRPDLKSVQGRGRISPLFDCQVTCILWTRAVLDEMQRDLIRLTDLTLGHFVYQAKLWDALLCYEPTDAQGNWLVAQPIWPGPAQSPMLGKGKDHVHPGWIWSGVEFTVKYAMLLPTPSSFNLG